MKKLLGLMTVLLTFATSAFAQLGSTTADFVYTPVTPCRVLDTRPSQGGSGPIAAAGTKTFFIWGATSYASQGGSPTNCGITAGSNVAAVAMNFTVVTPATGGFITAYPFGAALPTAATVNFQAGDIARGDFTIAKVAQTGLTSHLSIYSNSNADVVGDVVGYYSMPVATALQTIEVSASSAPMTSFYVSSGACPTGYKVTGAGFDEANWVTGVWIWQVAPRVASNDAVCRGNNTNSGAAAITCTAVCSRVPGR